MENLKTITANLKTNTAKTANLERSKTKSEKKNMTLNKNQIN